jgi:hypothetical protein
MVSVCGLALACVEIVATSSHVWRRALIAIAFLAATSGCATTKPWERENLAREEMSPDGDAARERLRHHVMSVREGAVGSLSGGGGGCGCN